jgi:hypothetical protein
MARQQFRRRKFCRFTADGITEIDYKDPWPCCLTPTTTDHQGERLWILSYLRKYRTWVTWVTW